MGFDSVPQPVSKEIQVKEVERKIKEIEDTIKRKETEREQAGKDLFKFTSNFAGGPVGASVDSLKLDQGDRSEEIKKTAYDQGHRIAEDKVNRLNSELAELPKQINQLLFEKQKIVDG